MTFLETMLRDEDMVRRLNEADDPVAEAFSMGATEEELLQITKDDYPADKRWEILSRIRFEAVRSICILGNAYSDTIANAMPEDEKLWGLRSYFWACSEKLNQPDHAAYPAGSLGSALHNFYENSGVPPISSNPFFPKQYIQVHDAHHVLLGSASDPRGELQIIAFENGMLQRGKPPLLLLDQLEILLKSRTPEDGGPVTVFTSADLCRAWEAGAVAEPLLDDWDFVAELDVPLEEVRRRHNIVPLTHLWDTEPVSA